MLKDVAWTGRLDAADSRFRGHFPGKAVLPGVAHLDLVLEALNGGDPPALPKVRVGRIERLRFRRPVEPGSELTIQIARESSDLVSFVLAADGLTASEGVLHLVAANP